MKSGCAYDLCIKLEQAIACVRNEDQTDVRHMWQAFVEVNANPKSYNGSVFTNFFTSLLRALMFVHDTTELTMHPSWYCF